MESRPAAVCPQFGSPVVTGHVASHLGVAAVSRVRTEACTGHGGQRLPHTTGEGTDMAASEESILQPLSEVELMVQDPWADVRGRKVLDASGEEIGKVDELLVDDAETMVRLLRVKHGGFLGIGADHFLVPVDAVTSVDDDSVRVDRERARLSDVPGYDPDLAKQPTYYGELYGWWGYGPYWGPGYIYPPAPLYPFT